MGRKPDGFSLLELLIALVVTLLVSGAVFGLLTAGQSAFRREPQLTERQQSLRQAMTMIQEDVMRAGSGVPGFVQVFTDGLNATGVPGMLGQGPTDALEILAGDPSCPPSMACTAPLAGVANNISVFAPPPACVQNSAPGFFAFFDDVGANFAVQPVTVVNPVPGCGAGQLTAGARVPGTPGVALGFAASGYTPVQLVRYEIAACPAPDAAVPCLYRSTSGTFDAAGAAVGPPPTPPWQVVARGIEDLQVQYRNGPNPGAGGAPWPWNPTPGIVVGCVVGAVTQPCPIAAAYNSLVTQVQVTLVARALAGGLQGETNNAGAPARVRGQLTGTFTPRTALATLSQAPFTPPLWR